MNDKKLFQQKKQAQLDEWRAKVEILKAKASGTSADIQLELNHKIEQLDTKLEEGKRKLADLEDAGEEAWESVVDGVENAWDSMKNAVGDAVKKFT